MSGKSYTIYPHILPDLVDWPIYKLSEDRLRFIEDIEGHTLDVILSKFVDKLETVVSKTIYMEKIRLKTEPWRADPPNEYAFWKKIQSRLTQSHYSDEKEKIQKELLKIIIHRYSEEIVGNFKISTFKFARKFLTGFFHRLLNTAASRNHHRIWGSRHQLYERLKVIGPIDKIRELSMKGTVIIIPTHFSNLDSILIGYGLDSILGLPAFSYAAGLNLYNSEIIGYFMNRLGAYRVDRRKKNPIYLETLKTMSAQSIERGVHSLFFPGGTRSRDGGIEQRLKLGLLGTLIEAQRNIINKEVSNKVFIVPLVLNYHCVLEAKFLINQHLSRTGKEKFITVTDNFQSPIQILKFAWQFFSSSSEITLSFGDPIDIAGNPLDEKGISYDENGNKIEIRDYFMINGEMNADLQREQVYTKQLADHIISTFNTHTVILSSHLVAYTAFNVLLLRNPELDLFGILRIPVEEFRFDIEIFQKYMAALQNELFLLEENGELLLSPAIKKSAAEVIQDGVKNIGVFHAADPLAFNKKGELISKDFKLLYYYHNRIAHYGLAEKVNPQFRNLEKKLIV